MYRKYMHFIKFINMTFLHYKLNYYYKFETDIYYLISK